MQIFQLWTERKCRTPNLCYTLLNDNLCQCLTHIAGFFGYCFNVSVPDDLCKTATLVECVIVHRSNAFGDADLLQFRTMSKGILSNLLNRIRQCNSGNFCFAKGKRTDFGYSVRNYNDSVFSHVFIQCFTRCGKRKRLLWGSGCCYRYCFRICFYGCGFLFCCSLIFALLCVQIYLDLVVKLDLMSLCKFFGIAAGMDMQNCSSRVPASHIINLRYAFRNINVFRLSTGSKCHIFDFYHRLRQNELS